LVGFDERRMKYPTMLPIPVDFLYENAEGNEIVGDVFWDDYKALVLDNTIMNPFLNKNPEYIHHRNMILFTIDKAPVVSVSSPKFIYVHIMLPHEPFVFMENGMISPYSGGQYDWQRYHENYLFFLLAARRMIENIYTASSGNAVIILQSDHGARNFNTYPYSGNFDGYSDEYKTWIVNAIYLPGCDAPPLSPDFDPINTFPVVFNCYFDSDLPIR
jgi:hypothetical protein